MAHIYKYTHHHHIITSYRREAQADTGGPGAAARAGLRGVVVHALGGGRRGALWGALRCFGLRYIGVTETEGPDGVGRSGGGGGGVYTPRSITTSLIPPTIPPSLHTSCMQAFEYHLFGDIDALSLARSVNLDQIINLGP